MGHTQDYSRYSGLGLARCHVSCLLAGLALQGVEENYRGSDLNIPRVFARGDHSKSKACVRQNSASYSGYFPCIKFHTSALTLGKTNLGPHSMCRSGGNGSLRNVE